MLIEWYKLEHQRRFGGLERGIWLDLLRSGLMIEAWIGVIF